MLKDVKSDLEGCKDVFVCVKVREEVEVIKSRGNRQDIYIIHFVSRHTISEEQKDPVDSIFCEVKLLAFLSYNKRNLCSTLTAKHSSLDTM